MTQNPEHPSAQLAITRRGLLQASGAVAAIGSLQALVPQAASGVRPTTAALQVIDAKAFKSPSATYWPGVRYAIQGNFDATDPTYLDGLAADLRQLYASGLSTIEIQATSLGVSADSVGYRNGLKVFYRVGNDLGMHMDLRVGGAGGISGGTPQALFASDALALPGRGTLAHGTQLKGTMPWKAATFDEKLVAVLAVRYTVDGDTKIQQQAVRLDVGDFSYVSASQADGSAGSAATSSAASTYDVTVTYTGADRTIGSASTETWSIIAFYKGVDSQLGGLDNTDFYSADSAEVIVAATDALFDDELKRLIRRNKGLFAVDGGDKNQTLTDNTWSDAMPREFERLYGYDVDRYLAVLFAGYELPEGKQSTLLLDRAEAMSYVFGEYYLKTIERWAQRTYNSGFRCQIGYSTELETGIVTQYVTEADVESYWASGGDSISDFNLSSAYLAVVSVSNVLRRRITAANELGATQASHSSSWSGYLLTHVNKSIYSGVNKQLYHVVESRYGNPWAYPYDGNFQSWGPPAPQFAISKPFNAYVARLQYLLQNGTAVRDIAVYADIYNANYTTDYSIDVSVEQAGFNWDILSPGVMRTENARRSANGTIDPSGGRYRALVITQILDGTMPLDTARTILSYARNGVPIVVVGQDNIPTAVMNLSDTNGEKELAAIFAEIERRGKLTVVGSQAGIVSALYAAGVYPDAKKSAPSRLVSYKRISDDRESAYYFLFNYALEGASATISQEVSLKGDGVPYLLDPWTGEVTPIARYTRSDGYVTVDVRLEPYEATVIGLRPSHKTAIHALSSSAGSVPVYVSGSRLGLQVPSDGTYRAVLSTGETRTVRAERTASELTLDSWDLVVESYYTDDYQSAAPEHASRTLTKNLHASLTELLPWSEISSIGPAVSGVGYYTTTFRLQGRFDGALLSLGSVFDTAEVIINGHRLYPDQHTMVVDLGGHLVAGTNTVEVIAPSDLENVLLANNGVSTTHDSVQKYGLLGPVTVAPYQRLELKRSI